VDHGAGRDKDGENSREPPLGDAILKGLENTFEDWRRWVGVGGASARRLRREMIKDNRPIPEGYAAHHIVPENDGRFDEATEARKILEKLGVDLNCSPNGVALPYKPEITEGGYHPAIHTGTYYRQVLDLLREAKTRDEALQILRGIGDRLSKGEFPKIGGAQ